MGESIFSGSIISTFLNIAESTLRVSTPLWFVAMAGVVGERSGVIQIGLEGYMLLGAFSASVAATYFHSAWMGLGFAILSGMILSSVYAWSVIRLRADQVVSGMAVNLLAAGVTPFLCKLLYGSTVSTPSLDQSERFSGELLWIALAFILALHLWMQYFQSGLKLRFAGEHPEALASTGSSVNKVRVWAVWGAGGVAAMGGAVLSTELSSSFTRNMTAGRGFMALAAVILGGWKPIPVALACVLFGFAGAMENFLQGITFWGAEPIPVQWIQIFPYLATLVILAGFIGKSRAPKNLGRLYTSG